MSAVEDCNKRTLKIQESKNTKGGVLLRDGTHKGRD